MLPKKLKIISHTLKKRFTLTILKCSDVPSDRLLLEDEKCPPPVDLLEGDFSYYELVKTPTVPPKGRTFVRPFLGDDKEYQLC